MWNAMLTKWYFRHFLYGFLPIRIQSRLVAKHGRLRYRQRFAPGYRELFAFLEKSQWTSPDEHRAYQESRLRKLIRHAYDTVPYYRRVMDERGLKPSDIESIDDLTKLPVLRKDDVREAGDELISTAFEKKKLRSATTSATTGSPLSVYWDQDTILINHACYMRFRNWAGVPFGTRGAAMQGKPVVPIRQKKPPFWRENPAWHQLRLSTLHMSDDNLPHYIKAIGDFGAESLETYASCAYIIARFLEAKDQYLPMTAVITTGEPLLDIQREVIGERFRAGVFDAYGQAERVVFATECEAHEGHHLHDEYGVTEFLDDDGQAVPDGTPGLLVGTSLHNFAMPLIRYACGDVGVRSERACSCGRSLPLMEGLTSREGAVIVTPDGRMLPTRNIGWSVRMMDNVIDWQVTQFAPHDILIRVVTDKPVTEGERERMQFYFAARLGPAVKTRIERVDEIPRSALGKSRHIISHVPLVWGSTNVPDDDEGAAPAAPEDGTSGS